MFTRKIFTAIMLAGSLCIALPAQAEKGAPRGMTQGAPGINCPAFQGQISPEAFAAAMQNCPAFNGQQQPDPTKCPAFQGNGRPPKDSPQAAIDKKMNRIVKALERNKRSADTLINAAREAGASPESVADMQRMSEAFRQVFMSTVSPEQIINSLISQKSKAQTPPEGMIITGPDGSTWLITPAQPDMAPAPQAVPPAAPATPKPAPKAGKQGIPPAQGKPSAIGRPGQPQFMPPAPPAPQPAPAKPVPPQMRQPQGAPQPAPAPGFRMPPAPPQQQGEAEVIIMEETVTPEYLPLWPTKDDLGKGGVLQYLEKRSTTMKTN